MTDAQTLSARYDDDGQKWFDADGVDLVDALNALVDNHGACKHRRASGVLYRLADGSWLVLMGGAWDVLDADGRCEGGRLWLDAEGDPLD